MTTISDETKEDLRGKTLRLAAEATTTDRNVEYGEPEKNLADIAAYWEQYLGIPMKAVDVAVMMILTKLARAETSPHKLDHWVDIAGYAACGAEIAVKDPHS